MKAFEKWFQPDAGIYVHEYEMQKGAWRAALKTVLKKMNENQFMANGELRLWIETELED